MEYLLLAGGALFGWAYGANFFVTLFGPAVSTGSVKWRTATVIAAFFIVFGAATMGVGGIPSVRSLHLVNGLTGSTLLTNASLACIGLLVSGFTVCLMTYFGIPISANQCITGALLGWGILNASDWSQNMPEFIKLGVTWVLNPLFSCLTCCVIVLLYNKTIKERVEHSPKSKTITKWGYLVVGSYVSFSCGVRDSFTMFRLYLDDLPFPNILNDYSNFKLVVTMGGVMIAIGILTCSRRVTRSVGEEIAPVTPQEGLLVMLAVGITIFVFGSPRIGINIPISAPLCIVGAIAGVGLSKGWRCINRKKIGQIFLAWIASPAISGLLMFLVSLFYRPADLVVLW